MKISAKIALISAMLCASASSFAAKHVLIKFMQGNSYMCYQSNEVYLSQQMNQYKCTWTLSGDQVRNIHHVYATYTGRYAGEQDKKVLVWNEKRMQPVALADTNSLDVDMYQWSIQRSELIGAPFSMLEAPNGHVILDLLYRTTSREVYTKNFASLKEQDFKNTYLSVISVD